jgi:two-component system LytT family response regulator
MPGATGLDVARRVRQDVLPLIAFVTAYDDHAIEAFELNAIDYLLKPVQADRLVATLDRARDRRRQGEVPPVRAAAIAHAAAAIVDRSGSNRPYLDRIPVRRHEEVVMVPVRAVAAVTADGELLHITTVAGERHTITHRLHALESRLDPRRFVRLGRGTLANVDLIARVSPMPGGTAAVVLTTGQELAVSRIQYRLLRETLLKL